MIGDTSEPAFFVNLLQTSRTVFRFAVALSSTWKCQASPFPGSLILGQSAPVQDMVSPWSVYVDGGKLTL